jgi:hypothetical protein
MSQRMKRSGGDTLHSKHLGSCIFVPRTDTVRASTISGTKVPGFADSWEGKLFFDVDPAVSRSPSHSLPDGSRWSRRQNRGQTRVIELFFSPRAATPQ